MMEWEDPELTSTHRHTKITTIYRATIDENDLKISRFSTTKGGKKELQGIPWRSNS